MTTWNGAGAFLAKCCVSAFMSFPLMFGLALVAPQLIIAAIGQQWQDCVPLLQILCLSGAFIPLYAVYQNLFLSLGKSDIYMWLNVAQIVLVISAVLACHSLGITAMVIAFACINIFWLLAWQFFASKLIGYSYLQMLRDLMPFMFISLAVMAVTWLITKSIGNIYLLMAARVIVAVLLYVLAMKLSGAKIYAESIGYFSDLFKRK